MHACVGDGVPAGSFGSGSEADAAGTDSASATIEAARAQDVLAAGLAEAGRTGKRVFLHSGAPWCGWCKRLEEWMARPEVAEILARDFVAVRIDMDEMVGAKAIAEEYVDGYSPIPWISILDSDGELVADSFADNGRNIGFPVKDWAIEHLGVMIREGAPDISEADLDILLESIAAVGRGAAQLH